MGNLAGPLLKPTVVTDGGPWADHNFPCPVCQANGAVLNLNEGVFEPCPSCQHKGWELRFRSRRFQKRLSDIWTVLTYRG